MNWEIIIKGKSKATMETDTDKEIFLHMYAVVRGLKSIAYFPLSKDEIETVGELANILSLDANVYENAKDDDYDIYIGSRGILYLLDKTFKNKFKGDEYHRMMGILCNIPDCCIDNFIKHKDQVELLDDYLKQLNGKKDPYNLWLSKKKYVIKERLVHIPCSPNCKPTKKLYTAYSHLWDELDKKYRVP